jgi:flotillin
VKELANPIVIGGIVLVVVIFVVARLFVRNYIKAPPNKVIVFTGRGKSKIVRSGGRFRIPGIERVDEMSLEPFTVEGHAQNVFSRDNVPVNVDAVGVVRFGSTDEAVHTAVERFLTTPREKIQEQVLQILGGIIRNIVAQMTIEDLNGNREDFRARVIREATDAFGTLGMELDVLTIQNITDNNGYLESLGKGRIEEVKAAADIRTANAQRDATVKSAAARQAGRTAEAEAATAIAEAERDRDLRLADIQSQVTAEQAKARANGERAEQEAQKAIIAAKVANEREQVQAEIGVEQLRAEKAEQTQQADVVKPAEAARQAATLRAEGEKAAAIAAAEADAESATLAGNADATARKARASAREAEMRAEAEGHKAQALAEAEGQQALAAALNVLTDRAAAQRVLPDLVKALPEMAAAIATPLGQIDRMVVIGGNGEGGQDGDVLSRVIGAVPLGLAQVIETIRATTGYDLGGMLSSAGANAVNPASPNGELVATRPADNDS